MPPISENTFVGVKMMKPDRFVLTGGTVNSSSITGIDATLVADKYRMGWMQVLDGNQAGKVYRVKYNTASAVYVNSSGLDETSNSMAATDHVALFPYKGFPDEDSIWMLIDSMEGLTPEHEIEELFAQTQDGEPYRHDSFINKKRISGTIELTPQNAKLFPLMFGKEVDTASAEATDPLDTNLDGAVYPGETVITVDSVTNAAEDDYIRIGSSSDGEIKKISSVSDPDITLTEGLRRYHADGATVDEMEDADGTIFTHRFYEYYDTPWRQIPFVLMQTYDSDSVDNKITQFYWLVANSVNFKNDGNRLLCSVGVTGFYYNYVEGTLTATVDSDSATELADSATDFPANGVRIGHTVTNVTDGSTGTITAVAQNAVTVGSLTGGDDNSFDEDDVCTIDVTDSERPTEVTQNLLLYSDSEVSINSVVDGQVRSMDCSVDYQAEEKWYSNDENDKFASEVIMKRATNTLTLGVRVNDATFLDLLEDGTKFDAYAKYSWNDSEYVKFFFKNCRVKNVPHGLPAGGPIETDLEVTPQYIYVEVTDQTQYH